MGMHELPKRKHIRLPNYDYSQNGVYFVTICTEGRRNILSEIVSSVGRDDPGAPLAAISPEVAEKRFTLPPGRRGRRPLHWLN